MAIVIDNEGTKNCMWRKKDGELCMKYSYCKFKLLKGCSL